MSGDGVGDPRRGRGRRCRRPRPNSAAAGAEAGAHDDDSSSSSSSFLGDNGDTGITGISSAFDLSSLSNVNPIGGETGDHGDGDDSSNSSLLGDDLRRYLDDIDAVASLSLGSSSSHDDDENGRQGRNGGRGGSAAERGTHADDDDDDVEREGEEDRRREELYLSAAASATETADEIWPAWESRRYHHNSNNGNDLSATLDATLGTFDARGYDDLDEFDDDTSLSLSERDIAGPILKRDSEDGAGYHDYSLDNDDVAEVVGGGGADGGGSRRHDVDRQDLPLGEEDDVVPTPPGGDVEVGGGSSPTVPHVPAGETTTEHGGDGDVDGHVVHPTGDHDLDGDDGRDGGYRRDWGDDDDDSSGRAGGGTGGRVVKNGTDAHSPSDDADADDSFSLLASPLPPPPPPPPPPPQTPASRGTDQFDEGGGGLDGVGDSGGGDDGRRLGGAFNGGPEEETAQVEARSGGAVRGDGVADHREKNVDGDGNVTDRDDDHGEPDVDHGHILDEERADPPPGRRPAAGGGDDGGGEVGVAREVASAAGVSANDKDAPDGNTARVDDAGVDTDAVAVAIESPPRLSALATSLAPAPAPAPDTVSAAETTTDARQKPPTAAQRVRRSLIERVETAPAVPPASRSPAAQQVRRSLVEKPAGGDGDGDGDDGGGSPHTAASHGTGGEGTTISLTGCRKVSVVVAVRPIEEDSPERPPPPSTPGSRSRSRSSSFWRDGMTINGVGGGRKRSRWGGVGGDGGGGGAGGDADHPSKRSDQPCLFPAALGGAGDEGGGDDRGDVEEGDVILVNPRSFEGGNIPTDLTVAFAKYLAETSNVASEDWARKFRFDDVLWPTTPQQRKVSSSAGTTSAPATGGTSDAPTSPSTSSPPASPLLPLATAICDDALAVSRADTAGAGNSQRPSTFECACLAYGSPGSGRSGVIFGDLARRVGCPPRGYDRRRRDGRDGATLASAGLVELVVGGLLRARGGGTESASSSGGNDGVRADDGGGGRRIITISILEVSREDSRDGLRDLLLPETDDDSGGPAPTSTSRIDADGTESSKRKVSLRVLEHEDRRGAIVRNLTEEVVHSVAGLRHYLELADSQRSKGTTADGELSSGSGGGHVIVTVKVYDSPQRSAVGAERPGQLDIKTLPACTMQFVDLASSDGGGGGRESERDVDAKHSHFVRKSLSALGALLRKLVVVQGGSSSLPSSSSISYRESILTRLLKRTLDPPGARAVLIAAVRRETRFYHQTLHSLNYANRLLSRPGTTARAPFLGGGRRRDVAMPMSSSPVSKPLAEEDVVEEQRGTSTPVRGAMNPPRSSCSPFRRASSASKSSLVNIPREIMSRGSPTKTSPEEIQRALFDHLIDQGSGGVRSDLLHSQVSDPRQRVAKFAKAISGWTPPDSVGNGSINGSHHASAGAAERLLPSDGGGSRGSSNVGAVRVGGGDRIPPANRPTVVASNARGKAPPEAIGGIDAVRGTNSSLLGHFERERDSGDNDDDHNGELCGSDEAFRTVDGSSTAAADDDWQITGMDAIMASTTELSNEGHLDKRESVGESSPAGLTTKNVAVVERTNRDAASCEQPDLGIQTVENNGIDGATHQEAWSNRGKNCPSGPILATNEAFAGDKSPVTCDDECNKGHAEDYDNEELDAKDCLRGRAGRLDQYPKDASLAETEVPRWPRNGSAWEDSQRRRHIDETSHALVANNTTTTGSTVLINDTTRGNDYMEEKFDLKEHHAGGKLVNDDACTLSQSPVEAEWHQENEHLVDGCMSIGGAPTSNQSHFLRAGPSPSMDAGKLVESTHADPLEEYVETVTPKMEDQARGTPHDCEEDYDKQTEASFASGNLPGSDVAPKNSVGGTVQPALAHSQTKGIWSTHENDVDIPAVTSSNHSGIGPSPRQISESEQMTLPDDESVRFLLHTGLDFEKFRSSIVDTLNMMETEKSQCWNRLSDAFLSLAQERDSALSRVRSIEQQTELERAQLTEEKGRADLKLADALHALELTRGELSTVRHRSKLDLRAEREKATVELEELRSDLGRREQTLEGLRIAYDHLKQNEQSTRGKLSDTVQERESLRESLREALDRGNKDGMELCRLRELLLATQKEVQEVKILNTEATRTRNLAENDLEEKNTVLSKTRKDLAEAEQSKLECEAAIERMNVELEEAHSSLQHCESTRAEIQSKYDALKFSSEGELSVVLDECSSLRQKVDEAQEISTRNEDELALLRKYRRDLEGKYDKSQRALSDLTRAKERAEENFTMTLANLESANKELASRDQTIHDLRTEIGVLRSGARESTDVIQEAHAKTKELRLARDKAQEKLEVEIAARVKLESALKRAEQDVHKCVAARETLQEQLTGVKETLKQSESTHEALERSKCNVEMQLQESLEDARLSKQECARAKQAIDELGSENERLAHELSNATSSLARCETFEQDMMAKYERLQASETEAQQKLQGMMHEHASVEERIRRANDDVERVCQERDSLKERLAEAEEKLCDPQYAESFRLAADLKAENQVLAGEAAKLRSSLQKSEDAIKWMKQQCDRYTSSAAHITEVQPRNSASKHVFVDRSVQVSSSVRQDNSKEEPSSLIQSVEVEATTSKSPSTELQAERLKRKKAEKLCAEFALRAKSSIDKRNAEILGLKTKLSKLSAQKDSEISSLEQKLSAEIRQREKAEELTATVSSRAKEKLENQSFEAEELRTLLESERTQRKNVLRQFSASAELDEANESNKLWAFVRKQDAVDEMREKLLAETQKERDEALKGLRKYKKMTRKLVQQLQDIDDRLPLSLHRDATAENAIVNGLSPPKVISNQPS